jgi:cell division septal protein FtsQ
MPRRLARRRRRWVRTVVRLTLVAVVALGAGRLSMAGLGFLKSNRAFAVKHVRVIGLTRHPAAPVKHALDPLIGKNLVRLGSGDVSERLSEFPWIAAFYCRKHLPDTLIIEVRERPVLCTVRTARGVFAVDGSGRVWPAMRGVHADFTLGGGLNPAAPELQALLGNLTSLGLSARVASVMRGPDDTFRLQTQDGWTLDVSPGGLAKEWDRFLRAHTWVAAHYPGRRVLDLRWTERVVLEPAGPQAGGEQNG